MLRTMRVGCGMGLLIGLFTLLPLQAQEEATLVLHDGQRPSGDLIDLNASGFILRTDGQERAFPASDVRVVEFAGGGPPSDAQSRIEAGQSFIVLRGGRIIDGRLSDIGGTHPLRVTIETSNGSRNFTSSEVAQVYLYGPGRAAATTTDSAPLANAISVPASQPWTNSGISVRKGQRLSFLTSGHIMLATSASSGVGGSPAATNPGVRYPVPDAPAGALIGRIDRRQPFAIGTNTQAIVMTHKGRLYLGVNDDHYEDNSGEYRVSVSR